MRHTGISTPVRYKYLMNEKRTIPGVSDENMCVARAPSSSSGAVCRARLGSARLGSARCCRGAPRGPAATDLGGPPYSAPKGPALLLAPKGPPPWVGLSVC